MYPIIRCQMAIHPSMTLAGSVCKRWMCRSAAGRIWSFVQTMFRELLLRPFNSSSAREHDCHMKPMRTVSCMYSRVAECTVEERALFDRHNTVLIEPIASCSSNSPNTDQGRSVPGVGIYPNGDTRQSKYIAYVPVLDARSANKVCGCSSRCLCWANIRDERLRTQMQTLHSPKSPLRGIARLIRHG